MFYFSFELLYNGIIANFMSPIRHMNPFNGVIQELFDLVLIGALCGVFYPRIWPEYFSIGLFEN